MVTFGVDAHKRTHTIVAVDDRGTPVGQTTVGTTSQDHLVLLRWAARFGAERRWAVEDCRHLSRRLERDLLAAGESIMRVPPKLMAFTALSISADDRYVDLVNCEAFRPRCWQPPERLNGTAAACPT